VIIYKATNKINGMVYVGCTTTSLEKRIASYKAEYKSKRNIIHSFILKMREFELVDFVFEQIDVANNVDEMYEKEIFWIAQYDSSNEKHGYNISPGGHKCSDETRVKRSNSLKGRIITKEARESSSKKLMGHAVSEETRRKISEKTKGRESWNTGTVGVCKANSGSFSPDKPAPNKGRRRMIIDGKIKFIRVES